MDAICEEDENDDEDVEREAPAKKAKESSKKESRHIFFLNFTFTTSSFFVTDILKDLIQHEKLSIKFLPINSVTDLLPRKDCFKGKFDIVSTSCSTCHQLWGDRQNGQVAPPEMFAQKCSLFFETPRYYKLRVN